MAINRATDLSNASNDLLLASVITERVATVMRPLVTVKTIPQGRNQITANTFGTVSISALTDGVDLAAPSSFTPTQFTLTASERGAMVVITDKARRETVGNVESDAGQELGNALAEDFDTQLFGQFDSFSTNALGSASTEISLVYALSGYSLLYGNSTQPVPATGKISYVGHTFTIAKLQSLLSVPGTSNIPPSLQGAALEAGIGRGKYQVGVLFDMGVYHSPKLTVASNAAKGAIFHEQALYVAEEARPRIEEERNASLRATEYVIVRDDGVGIRENEWGCELHFDSATPSGTTTL